MQLERRGALRSAFGGVAELSAGHPNSYIIGPTADLSRFGCFVATNACVPVGTEVSLKITYDGGAFHARGEVTYVLVEKGIGIRFAAAAPEDEALLEAWLRKIST